VTVAACIWFGLLGHLASHVGAVPSEAAAEAPSAVFYVDGLGATADDPSDDDTPGIQAAIDAAIAHVNLSGQGATVLLRGGGEYRLKSGRRGKGHLDLSCAPGGGVVTFAGQGATLIVETPRLGVFYANAAEAVLIKDVILDLDPLPHIACRVLEVEADQRRVVAQPFPGSTLLADFPGYSDEWGWLHDAEFPARPKKGAARSFRASERSQESPGGPIEFTLDQGVRMQDFAVGDVLSFLYRRGNNFRFQNSSDIELRNVATYGAGLFFVSTSHVDGLLISDCAVLLRPGRVQATGGDGIHLKYGRRVLIENSYFEGLSDDGVNVSGTYGFRIEGCEFRDKRRHAVVLDTDRVAYRSRDGVIRDNVGAFNGGSFLYHDGGDYSSVLVSGSTAHDNNLSLATELALTGALRVLEAGGQRPGRAGTSPLELAWAPSGEVSLLPADPPLADARVRHWRQISLATPRGQRWRIEAHRPGGPQPWRYLTASSPMSLERSLLGGPRDDPQRKEVDAQLWVRERLSGGGFRWRSELTGLYIARAPGSATELSFTADPGAALSWTLAAD
jgi:hypothetical protein